MADYVATAGSPVNGITLSSGDTLTVEAGGVATANTLLSGAFESVADGGLSISSIISNGGEQDVEGGQASGATILSGGEQYVFGSGSVISTLVQNGGVLEVDTGVASGTTVLTGGLISVGEGDTSGFGSAVNTTVDGAGAAEVFAGGSVLGTTVSSGGVLALIGGTEAGTTDLGGAVVSAGVLAQSQVAGFSYAGLATNGDTVSSGVLDLVFGTGGLATGTGLGSGAFLFVESGGVANGTQANGGLVAVESGGLASGALIGAGGRLLVDGGASYGADVTLSGAAGIIGSGILSGTTIESGGLGGAIDGEADGTDVRNGGALAALGGTLSNTTIESGGAVGLESFAAFGSNPASAVDTILEPGGYLVPRTGSVVSGTVELGGTTVTTGVFVVYTNSGSVFYPTSAVGLLLDGGSLAAVQAGGVLQGGLVEGGYPLLTSGATVFPIPSAVDVGPGGTVSAVTFADATGLDLEGNAFANVLTGSAVEIVESGGFDSGVTLSMGTMQMVEAGGTAVGAVISSGGEQVIDFTIPPTSVGRSGNGGGMVTGSVLLPGGELFFPDLSYLSSTTSASFDSGTGTLTVTNGYDTDSLTLAGNYSNVAFAVSNGGMSQDYGVLVSAQPACYCRGTLISTPRGEQAVETLAIGDAVVTAAGASQPIRWIGRRSYAGRFLAANPGAQPIRFRAGSLGEGLPRRDLLVSPEHAMFLDGLLIPARCLVNGSSIAQHCRLDRIDYYHVELDSHDVLLAEGAPSESFLDDNSRGMFHNASEFAALHPDAPSGGGFCAPKVDAGYQLETIRRRLAVVAGEIAQAA